jgi:hypothetical protein
MSVSVYSFLNLTAESITLSATGDINVSKTLVQISSSGLYFIENINPSASTPTGQMVVLQALDKFNIDQSGNIRLKDSTSMIIPKQSISFIYDGSTWNESGRTRDTQVLEFGGNSSSGALHYIDYLSYGSASSLGKKHQAVLYRNGVLSRLDFSFSNTAPTRGTLLVYLNGTAILSYTYTSLIALATVRNGNLTGRIELDNDVNAFDVVHLEFNNCDFNHTRCTITLS